MRKLLMTVVALAAAGAFAACDKATVAKIAAGHKIVREDVFCGYDRVVFDFGGHEAWIVFPKDNAARKGNPWTWTMQWATAFVSRTNVPQMLADGYHHVTIEQFAEKMDEKGLALSAAFQKYLVGTLGFAPKANLIGMSWGGFFSVRYAATYPENVAKIYLDCPFLHLGGCCIAVDIGPWEENQPENWIDDPRMPINLAKPIAEAKIPILLAYGGADNVLDPRLNSEIFIPRFKASGGDIQVIYRKAYGHHPHGFEESEMTIIDFFTDKGMEGEAEK